MPSYTKNNPSVRRGVRYSSCNRGENNNQRKASVVPRSTHKPGGVLAKFRKKKPASCQPSLRDINRRRSAAGYQVVAPSKNWQLLLRDFTQSTTLHGIRYTTLETRFVFRRIFWWFIVGATLGIFIFYVWDRVGEYLKYKKNVSVEENYVAEMTFPSVTFCNQNRIRLTAAAEKGWYHKVKEMFPDEAKSLRACHAEEFSCMNKPECVPLARRCDGFPDCQDETDEIQCNPCPRLLLIGGIWDGTVFDEQPNTFELPGPVYMGVPAAGPQHLFLNYNESQAMWQMVSKLHTDKAPHASAQNHSHIFPMQDWTGPANTSTFNFRCHHSLPPNAALRKIDIIANSSEGGSTGWANYTSMEELYREGTHEPSVFIEKCTWKGHECFLEKHFKETYTDMGKCYTFQTDEMLVESSGPGHGLILSLNIEQYEYTKNPATGVGVKVLFHEHSDKPMMSEKSIAISPGLYSLLAIEKTLIENLKHPWGNCTELELSYYNTYTVSTCKMECDNVNARAQCGCRNAHMPEIPKGSDKRICSVHDYISCWLPYIREKMKSKDYCKCNLPCLEVAYVPSLSFAAISTDEDAIQSRRQEQKMANLQQKLTKAREIAYRLAEDKYRETMRMLHMIQFRSNNMVYFFDVAQTILADEKVKVFQLYDIIQTQCMDVVQTLAHLEAMIRSSLQPSLNQLQSVVIMLNFQVSDFSNMLENGTDSLTAVESRFLNDQGFLEYNTQVGGRDIFINDTIVFRVSGYTLESNITFTKLDNVVYFTLLRSRATTVINSIKFVQSDLLKHMDNTISNFPNISGIQIATAEQTYTIASIKKVLKTFVGEIDEKLSKVGREVHNSMQIQTAALHVGIKRKVKYDYMNLKELVKSVNSTIYNNIVVVLAELTSVISRLSPKCEYESSNLLQIYSEIHKQIKSNLQENKDDCNNFLDELSQTMQSYINGDTTLSKIAANFQLMQFTSDLQSNKLTIGNLLQQNVVSIRRLMEQNDLISTNISQYTRDFLTSPDVSRNLFPLAYENARTGARPADHSVWLAMVAKINSLQNFMGHHIRNLSTVLKQADKYLQNYADGNVLNENFFKKNYLQLDLFYKTLTDKKVIQQKAYEYPALLSEVGGLMGLLLGASVITIFECIDLLFYNGLVKLFERKCTPRDKVRDIRRRSVMMNSGSKHFYPHQVLRRGPLNVPIATFDPMDGLEYSPHSSPLHNYNNTL